MFRDFSFLGLDVIKDLADHTDRGVKCSWWRQDMDIITVTS